MDAWQYRAYSNSIIAIEIKLINHHKIRTQKIKISKKAIRKLVKIDL